MRIQKSRKTILIIDDDKTFCQSIKEYLESDSVEVFIANNAEEGRAASSRGNIDIVLLDQKLPDAEGDTLCAPVLKHNEQAKIIFITAHASFEGAVKAMKSGAFNYLSKPFELEELDHAIEQATRTSELEKIEQIQRYQLDKESGEVVLIGENGGLSVLRDLIQSAALVEAPVLITGETGTGKNVLAKAIHYRGPFRRAPFISINCAALPENLIESELFGYEKGAFTGAVSAKRSIFEMADGGTLFLDEIGEMPLHLQAKLLGVLEDKKIRRLGGETVKTVNARIIAATGKDLEKELDKTFRKDLYFRLSVIRIHIPPLRERRQDIPELCDYFIRKFQGGKEISLPEPELATLRSYQWPGNIRELSNVLERAVILHKGPGPISPSKLLCSPVAQADITQGIASNGELRYLDEMEKEYIKYALDKLSDNYTQTAKALGISLSTLKRKVKEYGLK